MLSGKQPKGRTHRRVPMGWGWSTHGLPGLVIASVGLGDTDRQTAVVGLYALMSCRNVDRGVLAGSGKEIHTHRWR